MKNLFKVAVRFIALMTIIFCVLFSGCGGGGSNDSATNNNPVTTTNNNSSTSSTKTIQKVSAGYEHTCALLSDNTIKCWGYNASGQLGNGTNTNSNVPVSVSGVTTAVSVSTARYNHTCTLLSDNTVKCWGYNAFGQLGNGTTTDSTTPVLVSGITTATSISAGGYYSCALLSTGAIKCWGENIVGELGNGTSTETCDSYACSKTPVSVTGISNAISISAGDYHTCALLSDGSIKCWGKNNEGQLGNGTTTDSNTPVSVSGITNALSVSTVGRHTCALLSDSTIKCWGDNGDSQLGNGTTIIYSTTPVSVSGISNATSVSAGGYHTCALLSDNTLKCWGYNAYGQLGNGTTTNSNVPVSVDSSLYAFYKPNKFLMEKIYIADKSADYNLQLYFVAFAENYIMNLPINM